MKKDKKSLKLGLRFLGDIFIDCISYVRRLGESIARACYWGWALRHNHDWDYAYLDHIMLLKLRRMHRLMAGSESMHDPSCQNYAPKMRSLKLALKLAERLQADKYYANVKYPIDFKLEPATEKYFKMVQINPATKMPATKLYLQLALEEWARLDRRQDRDRQIMYRIIAKYGTYWWD